MHIRRGGDRWWQLVIMLTDEEIIERWKLSCLCGGVSAITTAKMVRNFYEARIAEDAKVRAQLELALTAAIDRMCSEGCDCGTDEPETCALCVCEAALAAAKEIK